MDPFSVAGISGHSSLAAYASAAPRLPGDQAALDRLGTPETAQVSRTNLSVPNLHEQMGTQLMAMLMGLMSNPREG